MTSVTTPRPRAPVAPTAVPARPDAGWPADGDDRPADRSRRRAHDVRGRSPRGGMAGTPRRTTGYVRVPGIRDATAAVWSRCRPNRPFGPVGWPTWWLSEMEVDHATPAIRFRHVEGITTGMDVEWSFTPAEGGTLVRILHVWDGPRWPLIGNLCRHDGDRACIHSRNRVANARRTGSRCRASRVAPPVSLDAERSQPNVSATHASSSRRHGNWCDHSDRHHRLHHVGRRARRALGRAVADAVRSVDLPQPQRGRSERLRARLTTSSRSGRNASTASASSPSSPRDRRSRTRASISPPKTAIASAR